MFKYIAILVLVNQALAMPGMGGFGMNPWMSQWMTPGAAPWAAWVPQADGTSAQVAPPASPPFAGFGKGGMAFGAMGKQLGLAQALIGMNVKTAQDEVKMELDKLKGIAAISVDDECNLNATTAASDVENQLLTAFDACKMKNDMAQMRLQGLQYKQQLAAMKMAKKACKMSLDPVTCLADATSAAETDPAVPAGSQTLADVNTKADQCIVDVKDDLIKQIDAALDDLINC